MSTPRGEYFKLYFFLDHVRTCESPKCSSSSFLLNKALIIEGFCSAVVMRLHPYIHHLWSLNLTK